MSTPVELKTCRKGLHLYGIDTRRCPECRVETIRQWRLKNLERYKENTRKWREENHERFLALNRKSRNKHAEQRRKEYREWAVANPDKRNALTAKRRASKKQAIAPWANNKAIKAIYAASTKQTKETGVKYHVDHIYPLKNDYLCGLHVETNLQILTEAENITKGNRTWPGQLDCQKGSVYAIFPKELTDLLND
jgi:hypothetical protein